jgi:GNAT superfamily N-acetyltransferase
MSKIELVDATDENICDYGFCGYKNVKQEGYRRKSNWLKKRFEEGLRFKILHALDEGSVGFIEYVPGRYAWRPVDAPGYMVVHCLMIHRKAYKGKGYGSLLLDACLEDAKREKMNGVAVVTSSGTWMAGSELFLKHGVEAVDSAPPSYALMVKAFKKAPPPRFKGGFKKIPPKYRSGLVIIRSDQCPCIANFTRDILAASESYGIHARVEELKTCKQAQNVPSAYGIFNLLYNGEVIANHPISAKRFTNIMKKLL